MKVLQYLRETKTEMSHVNWPTRKQVVQYTILVLVISGITAYILGFFDFLFAGLITRLIGLY